MMDNLNLNQFKFFKRWSMIQTMTVIAIAGVALTLLAVYIFPNWA